MARPVISVASGGLPVTEVSSGGLAVTEAYQGIAVTKVAKGGLPVTYVATMIAMPPVPTGSSATTGTPTVISISMNNTLNTSIVPAAADFAVTWGGVAKPVSSVNLASRKINLVMGGALGTPAPANSTVSYTPGATPMKGVDGRLVASFSNVTIA